ncbi:putative transcriptional regulator [Aurantimicrobium minutum]|uniref:BlaI/MecI/CopY family transcriptional regulator n=1 Tax=Aurantimicrobium minutum TaxID=708131 RepID=UPI00247612A8|nr:BlaI/MecI/CopY family transcriptional regulator [Aurantimicrobium minutum]MDH6278770.1 putative transcriptional regulator [Aurantimicrobium minutum]
MTTQRNRGELEADIMTILWQNNVAMTAKEVQAQFTEKIPAITTLITVLDRMCAKGQVVKNSTGGRSQTFAAAQSRIDHVASTMTSALQSADDQVAALLHFAGSLSEEDRAFLRKAIDKSE